MLRRHLHTESSLQPSALSRRRFLNWSAIGSMGLAASMFSPGWSRETGGPLCAAVIGHTGRGDYGHGLEGIFQGREGIELVALADPDPEGRSKTGTKIGAQRLYADYRDLLESEKPNLVSIAMRHADQHFSVGLAALQAGAHLYVEKPFTTTPEEADILLMEAARRRCKIAVAHTLRLLPSVVRFHQAVREGLLGEIAEVRAYGKQDQRAGGEDMIVLGTHLFDLLRLFCGDPLWCTARILWKQQDIIPADARLVKDNVGWVAGDQVFAQFAFPKGVNATFTSSALLRETVGQWGIEFQGSIGAGRILCDIAPHVFVRRSVAWGREGRTDVWEPFDSTSANTGSVSQQNPVSDWLAAIRDDREPECSGRNGAWAVEMVAGVYQAALSKNRIAFPLVERGHPLVAKR